MGLPGVHSKAGIAASLHTCYHSHQPGEKNELAHHRRDLCKGLHRIYIFQIWPKKQPKSKTCYRYDFKQKMALSKSYLCPHHDPIAGSPHHDHYPFLRCFRRPGLTGIHLIF